MKSLLANMRLYGMISEARGEDWLTLSEKIDQELEGTGHDLSEESVYLFYSQGPEAVLEGQGECFVARSVIGPKTELPLPFLLRDWTASQVEKVELSGEKLEDFLKASMSHYKSTEKKVGFTLVIKRRLDPSLRVSVEGVFHE